MKNSIFAFLFICSILVSNCSSSDSNSFDSTQNFIKIEHNLIYRPYENTTTLITYFYLQGELYLLPKESSLHFEDEPIPRFDQAYYDQRSGLQKGTFAYTDANGFLYENYAEPPPALTLTQPTTVHKSGFTLRWNERLKEREIAAVTLYKNDISVTKFVTQTGIDSVYFSEEELADFPIGTFVSIDLFRQKTAPLQMQTFIPGELITEIYSMPIRLEVAE